MIAFNRLARPGSEDFGLLYVGFADGGSGGDPFNHAQNLANPFVKNPRPGALGEIYAYGLRNPQRFWWDSKNGAMLVADIGQNIVEKISLVTAGANLGWNKWEGSFTYDPLLRRPAITGVYAYRQTAIRALANKVIFGDNPSGEIFYVDADNLPKGGQDSIRRILFSDKGASKTLLQLIQDKNTAQGRTPATRADLRLGVGPEGQIFVLNKRDGVIRLLVP